ncbi:EAL domain-containing protein [Skermanella mucosa]|uniref:sensor domain-containing phosphodiesterase n=1 Tax=Skermanella mucosa TaxID=1789672 RepID=UPI00192ABC14|nr:EAL domain-containing protein [Skermanella mucosa]UEM20874.1 EAL domain-containing protein [Skermanella mucosa]
MKSQLQRFISFAFAAADLLIEVGPGGEIRFAIGAASTLTDRRDDELIGRDWLDLFDPADRKAVRGLAATLGPQGRSGPLEVRMAPAGLGIGEPARRASLSACRLAGPQEWLSCVLTALPAAGETGADPGAGLVGIEDFVEAASRAGGAGANMTLVEAPGLLGLAQSDPAMCNTLVQRISTLLRNSAVDGNAAARLGEARFGVTHRGGDSILRQGLADITEEGARNGIDLGLSAHDMALDSGGLGQDELLQAVRFAVNRFSTQGPAAALPGSMTQAFEQMVDTAIRRMNDFAEVIREEKFDLSFQPIVELATGALHHFEVLARFKDGSSPFEKVQFAEEIGVIEKFDFAVCTRSISAMRSRDRERGAGPLRLAVNLSGQSLENAVFIRLLLALLDENRDLAGRLSLEITESARLRDLARADQVIQQVRRRGFAVYLDDFGAGAASFQYLQALAIDGVKIDGSYIRRIGGSRRDDTLLRGLARLCGDLEIRTVGEMVETAAQSDFLRGIGVTLGQGWLFGKATPVPVWTPVSTPKQLEPVAPSRLRGRRQGAVESWS